MRDLELDLGRAGELIRAVGPLLPPDEAHGFEARHADIARRLGYAGEEVLVALVGGTGSGKSSVLNALAGGRIAAVGALRPTTDQPLAWIPSSPDPGLTRLLGELGIDDRRGHDGDPWLAVIDTPDVDSVETSHRRMVERLIPKVDVIAWVLDPEKYADRVIHEDFIRPLKRYRSQFVFILNQVDRVSDADRAAIVAHLSEVLAAEGIHATVITTAANPPGRAPAGIGELRSHLTERLTAKGLVRGKLAMDLDGLVEQVSDRIATSGWIPEWHEVARPLEEAAHALLAPPVLDRQFARAGVIASAPSTSGPLGFLLGLLRRGGRIVGAPQTVTVLDETTGRWREREGRAALDALASTTYMDAAVGAGPVLGTQLRRRAVAAPADVDAAIESARRFTAAALDVVPQPWWVVLGVLNWVGALAVFAAVGWAWLDPSAIQRGGGLDPILIGGAGLALTLVMSLLGRMAGRIAGRRSAQKYRAALDAALSKSIDRRIGEPYREHTSAAKVVQRSLQELRKSFD